MTTVYRQADRQVDRQIGSKVGREIILDTALYLTRTDLGCQPYVNFPSPDAVLNKSLPISFCLSLAITTQLAAASK